MASLYARVRLAESLGLLAVLACAVGCKDLTGSQALPAGTPNPAFYNTRDGALGMRTQAMYTLQRALPNYLIDAGLLTDELEDYRTRPRTAPHVFDPLPLAGSVDARKLPEQGYGSGGARLLDADYAALQRVRGEISQALGALAAYDTAAKDTATQKMLRGELFALRGYAEILLADLFCSGVPLSTLDFQRDYTYHAGSSTDEVYQDAVSQEDSALALADTNHQILNLALVLKGRALLNRGLYAQATQVVANVPNDFQYKLAIEWQPQTEASQSSLFSAVVTVSDSEGQTGVPFISSNDPRSAIVPVTLSYEFETFIPQTFPAKYNETGFSPFVVADGIEARLMTAEAALQATPASSQWLTILNAMRTTCTVGVPCPTPAPAGTAGIAGLPLLSDPGIGLSGTAAMNARVALLFQERAYWLFVTGHRQGDLRRLVRQYGRSQDEVYPSGLYLGDLGGDRYGSDITAPVPSAEYVNPLFHGCKNRAA